MLVNECISGLTSKRGNAIRAARSILPAFLILLLLFSSTQLSSGSPGLEISLSTAKQIYSAGDRIDISGNMSLNDNLVPDGVVAVEIDDARGYPRIIRARPTGANITKQWAVEILEVIPRSYTGPTYTFRRGSDIGFNVTLRNNDLGPKTVNLTICIYYPDEVVLRTASIWNGTIGANSTELVSSFPIAQISSTAALGTGYAYASVLRPPLPKEGGFAYSPEKSVAFNIVPNTYSSSSTESSVPLQEPDSSTEGAFNVAFRIPKVNARLGNYTVYATSLYVVGAYPYFATSNITFKVLILGDLNLDGKCDIKDISIVAKAYGSYPGYPNWNPIADVYPDSRIDIKDVATVAKDYGKSGIYP